MTEDYTLPDFQIIPNSHRNMCLIAKKSDDNNMCSKIIFIQIISNMFHN